MENSFFFLRLLNAIFFFPQKLYPCFTQDVTIATLMSHSEPQEKRYFLVESFPSILFANYNQRSRV